MSRQREDRLENCKDLPQRSEETGGQEKMADELPSSSPKSQTVVETCRTPIERSLLAHFFFIFAASFILGVIFLHSSLRFWSWQENNINEHGAYSGQHEAPSEGYLYDKSSQQNYYNAKALGDTVMTIILSPNMTLALSR